MPEPEKPAAPAAPAPTPLPETFEFDRDGQPMSVTRDQLVDLAKKGLQYDGMSPRLRQAEQFISTIDSNPRLREAVQRAVSDPESVLSPSQPARSVSRSAPAANDDDDGDAKPIEQPVISPDLTAAERRIAAMEQRFSEREQRDYAATVTGQIQNAVASLSHLKDSPAAQKLVQKGAIAHLRENPRASVTEAVAAANGDYVLVERERLQSRLTQADATRGMRAIQSSRGTPAQETPVKRDPMDLTSGRTRERAKAAIIDAWSRINGR